MYLCGTCHRQVHAAPYEAQQNGWIVSRHVGEPGMIPVSTAWGPRYHSCGGGIRF